MFTRKRVGFLKYYKKCLVFFALLMIVPNLWIVLSTLRFLPTSPPEMPRTYALVLGAGVRGLTLSGALRARMQMAVQLYLGGMVKRILISGDGTGRFYNETLAMKQFALRSGVQEAHIVVDYEGTSTFASLLRAKQLWGVNSCYVISQPFHLPRAVWLGRRAGMDAWGTGAELLDDEWIYTLREWLARAKDFWGFLVTGVPHQLGPRALFPEE